ncbi:MAG: 5-deoxy-glucuronate isomerase [Deltaproteobacteria bacterium]|nr:5-deoxy-glucuronate isomerase [Deltaproteobacteria bacterium]
MKETMKKYAERIERNEIDPHVRYNGQTSGLILDPRQEEVPLEILGFGIYPLGTNLITRETMEKEVVLVPQEGEFEAEVNGKKFFGKRAGGAFAVDPGQSNASALYIPCNARFTLRGNGEVAFFEAPALKEKPLFFLSNEDVKVISRGDWIWRRDVIPLISPKDVSSNLIVGETYSPPGFWSGTPLHQHDGQSPGESDHEEVYYHRFYLRKKPKDQFGPYGVQLLMDGKNLMKAFLIGDRSAFAIPGGCHPVVASPVSELLYLWGLASRGDDLLMRDIPEFVYLKSFEEIFKELERDGAKRTLSKERFKNLCEAYPLTEDQSRLLAVMLKEKGYRIE